MLAALSLLVILIAPFIARADVGTAETVAKHVEEHTSAWLVVGAAVGPILGIGVVAVLFVKFLIPFLREEGEKRDKARADEAEKSRAHASELAKARDEAHRAQISESNKNCDEQHKRTTADISGRVDRLSERVESVRDRVDDISKRTGAIAAKLGVTTLIAAFAVGGVLGVAGTQGHAAVKQTRKHQSNAVAQATSQESRPTCDPPCSVGEYCCATPEKRRCCEVKRDTAGKKEPDKASADATPPKDGRTGALWFVRLDGHAAGWLSSRWAVQL